MSAETVVNLYGRVFVRGDIRAVTGLHIGRGKEALEIGGVDNPVVRDPLTNRPYVPGSSLKGKMRSLWEKMTGAKQNFLIGRIKGKEVRLHVCDDLVAYQCCPVCPIYGVPGDKGSSNPTRLVVRDVLLSDDEAERLENEAHTDLPYTEVKWEAAIDRVTSAATPRPMERVPAGTCFEGLEMVFSIYEADDLERFVHVLQAMQLLQDDYLGGLGSRGSGKVVFEHLSISIRSRQDYGHEETWMEMPEAADGGTQVSLVLKEPNREKLVAWLKDQISFEPYGV
jgi:CRISPR-associated protein Csm3